MRWFKTLIRPFTLQLPARLPAPVYPCPPACLPSIFPSWFSSLASSSQLTQSVGSRSSRRLPNFWSAANTTTAKRTSRRLG